MYSTHFKLFTIHSAPPVQYTLHALFNTQGTPCTTHNAHLVQYTQHPCTISTAYLLWLNLAGRLGELESYQNTQSVMYVSSKGDCRNISGSSWDTVVLQFFWYGGLAKYSQNCTVLIGVTCRKQMFDYALWAKIVIKC